MPLSHLPLEYVPCNVCHADRAQLVASHNGYSIVRCLECALVYVNPRPSHNALVALYADYHSRYGGDESRWNRLMEGVFREAADLLAAQQGAGQRPRLLDIGCGFGGFVGLMRKRGWEAEGVDPSPSVVETAKARGYPVRLGTMEDLPLGSAFDAITMFYVLEHLPDPMSALRKAFELLIPGGILLIRVPHTTPIVRLLAPLRTGAHLYDAPFHLFDFCPAVLRQMLGRVGFKTVRMFPGQGTLPHQLGPRLVSRIFGAMARGVFAATGGTVLFPGVSKTTMARKPTC